MSAHLEALTAMRVLAAEATQVIESKSMTPAQKSSRLDQIETQIENHKKTVKFHDDVNRRYAGSGDSAEHTAAEAFQSGGRKGVLAGLVASGYQPIPAPQLDLEAHDAKELFEAAVSRKSFAVSTKTPTDSTSIAPATITDFRLPPVTARREPTRVLSLIPTVATAHPSVTWYSTTGTTAAAAVAEGGTKPTSTIAYTAQTSSVTKIAHVAEVTDETLQDFPAFMSVLQQDMIDGLIHAENAELLNASVTGAHKFPGLLNASGILTRAKSTEPWLDTIEMAFDDLRAGSSFTEPDGMIMSPATWGFVRRLKDGNQRYYMQLDPTRAADPHVWGTPVVLTTQIADGTILAGDFAGSTVAYVRDGIRVETANQGTAQFTGNSTLVRAEERLLVTVPRPTGLIKITGIA